MTANSSLEIANRTLTIAASALSALDIVGTLASGFLTGSTAQEAHTALGVLQAIEAIVADVRKGFDGVLTKEEIDRHLQERTERLIAGDAAAQMTIDDRFPK